MGGIVHQFTNFGTLEDCGKTTTAWLALLPGPEFEAGAALEVTEEGGAVTKVCEGGGSCFAAGTSVWMADGTLKPIEDVRSGDWVLSRDPLTGTNHASQVSTTVEHQAGYTVDVTVSDPATGQAETISASPEHPFYTTSGFVPAHSLLVGMSLATRAGPSLSVISVEDKRQEGGTPVYNFTVPGDHTYFVGTLNGGAWVHNPIVCPAVEGDGGTFADLTKRGSPGDDLTPHHWPQDGLGFLPRDEGWCTMMKTADHYETRTYGYKGAATKAADAGKPLRSMLATEIRDLRRVGLKQHGSRKFYGKSIKEGLAYYRRVLPSQMKK